MFTIYRLKNMTAKPEFISAFDQCTTRVNIVKKKWSQPEIIHISSDHVTAKNQPFAHEKTLIPVPGHPSHLQRPSTPSVWLPAANKSHYLS